MNKFKHWLAIIGVDVYTQNGREMLSVSNNRMENLGRKIGKRIWFSNKSYNLTIEGSYQNQETGAGKRMGCYCESNIISGIPNSNRKEWERDEKFVKMVAIPHWRIWNG